jgi:GNAT superfamily N-acetyltransferase
MDPLAPDTLALWRFIGDALAGYMRAAPAHEIRRTPGGVLALSGEAGTDLNYLCIGQGADPVAQLRDYGAVIQARGLPAVVIASALIAEEVAPAATAHGFTRVGGVPLMTYGRPGIPDVSQGRAVQVAPAVSAADLRAVNSILAAAFAMPEEAVQRAWGPALLDVPGFAAFLARQGETSVSTVATFRHGATVGVWSMATLPGWQRTGVGIALLTHVMAQHWASGARLFYLLATEAGYPLYERVGFRTVETMAVWIAGPPAPGHS